MGQDSQQQQHVRPPLDERIFANCTGPYFVSCGASSNSVPVADSPGYHGGTGGSAPGLLNHASGRNFIIYCRLRGRDQEAALAAWWVRRIHYGPLPQWRHRIARGRNHAEYWFWSSASEARSKLASASPAAGNDVMHARSASHQQTAIRYRIYNLLATGSHCAEVNSHHAICIRRLPSQILGRGTRWQRLPASRSSAPSEEPGVLQI